MKKILMAFLLVVSLSACTNNAYERDTSEGEIKEISYTELSEKLKDDNGKYMVLISQTQCGGCIELKEVLDKYLEEHNITVYELNITNEKNPKETFFEIRDFATKEAEIDSNSFGTPFLFIKEKGKLVEYRLGAMEEDELESLVIEYQLDEKR